jgi:putative endonuclease
MHKNEVMPGFTKQYGVKVLVWYEQHETREAALVRERQMKKWNRAWKLRLIQETNPQWIRSLRGLVALSSGSPPSRGRTVAV